MKSRIRTDLPVKVNGHVIDLDYGVPRLHTGFLCRIIRQYIRDLRLVVANAAHEHKRKHKGHDKVKERTCKHDAHSGPYGFGPKCPLIRGFLILSLHHAGSAKRQKLDGILGLSLLDSPNSRSKSQRELIHLDSIGLCEPEMPQLVKNNDNAKYN